MAIGITDPDKARHLARAIVADIRLYNADALAHGQDVAEAIAEGRALYESRAAPEHHGAYDEAVADLLGPDVLAPAPVRAPTEVRDVAAAPSSAASSPALAWLLLACVVLGAAAWFALR